LWKYKQDERFENLSLYIDGAVRKIIKNGSIIEQPFTLLDLIKVLPVNLYKTKNGWFIFEDNKPKEDRYDQFINDTKHLIKSLVEIRNLITENHLQDDLDCLPKLYSQYTLDKNTGN
jgi:hypothetical protein